MVYTDFLLSHFILSKCLNLSCVWTSAPFNEGLGNLDQHSCWQWLKKLNKKYLKIFQKVRTDEIVKNHFAKTWEKTGIQKHEPGIGISFLLWGAFSNPEQWLRSCTVLVIASQCVCMHVGCQNWSPVMLRVSGPWEPSVIIDGAPKGCTLGVRVDQTQNNSCVDSRQAASCLGPQNLKFWSLSKWILDCQCPWAPGRSKWEASLAGRQT